MDSLDWSRRAPVYCTLTCFHIYIMFIFCYDWFHLSRLTISSQKSRTYVTWCTFQTIKCLRISRQHRLLNSVVTWLICCCNGLCNSYNFVFLKKIHKTSCHWLCVFLQQNTGVQDEDFISFVNNWWKAGASLFGGCCRTTPKTISGIYRTLAKRSVPPG